MRVDVAHAFLQRNNIRSFNKHKTHKTFFLKSFVVYGMPVCMLRWNATYLSVYVFDKCTSYSRDTSCTHVTLLLSIILIVV